MIKHFADILFRDNTVGALSLNAIIPACLAGPTAAVMAVMFWPAEKSTRMGRDKALLMLHGETLLERAAKAVFEACGHAVLVGDPARHRSPRFPIISDLIPGAGPLSGIHAALSHSALHHPGFAWNLIVACDMPGLAAHTLAGILNQMEAHPDAEVLLPESGGLPQPLCAVYRTRILPHLESALRSGCFKLTAAIAPLAVVRMAIDDEALFRNVNTPQEWNALAPH